MTRCSPGATKPLNYLRQATEELRRIWIPAYQRHHPEDARICDEILTKAAKAPKFVLPKGGRIFDDRLRGLPDELHLPYPELVIEYEASENLDGLVAEMFGSENLTISRKRIVYAKEDNGWIYVHSIVNSRSEEYGTFWQMLPFFELIKRDYELNVETPPGLDASRCTPGMVMEIHATGTIAPNIFGPYWRKNAYADLNDENMAVLELIEALSCINVTHEALPVRKQNKCAIRRGALPFDEYRVLVIKNKDQGHVRIESSGSHRSPREHLRRGHIRRLQDGRKVWVNSTVVNAGAAGKITTTYDMREAA
jgi:hypothetical protein